MDIRQLRASLCSVALISTVLVAAQPLPISGIFEAGWNSFFRDADGWKLQCERIREMGMETLILQYSVSYPDRSYLEQSFSWGESLLNESYFERAIPAAQEAGLELYLGVYAENEGWFLWDQPVPDGYLERQVERIGQVIDLLEERFPSPVVKGYYLPHEIARYYWKEPADLERLRNNFLIPVAQKVRATGKRFLISPFYNPDLESPEQLQQFMAALLSGSGIDIIAIQDGVGSSPKRLPHFGSYLRAVEAAAEQSGVEYWVNIELFPDPSGDDPQNPPSGLPLLERIQLQLDSAHALPYCSKLISYDYSSVTADHYAHTMNPLFDSLQVWNRELATPIRPTEQKNPQPQLWREGRQLWLANTTASQARVALYSVTGVQLLPPTSIRVGEPLTLPAFGGIIYAKLNIGSTVQSFKLTAQR